jgi:hypothetical protein
MAVGEHLQRRLAVLGFLDVAVADRLVFLMMRCIVELSPPTSNRPLSLRPVRPPARGGSGLVTRIAYPSAQRGPSHQRCGNPRTAHS